MIKAKASGSKVYLYFMKKGRQARHRIPRNSCSQLYPTHSRLVYDLTETILAILCRGVSYMLPAKYQPNPPGGSGKEDF